MGKIGKQADGTYKIIDDPNYVKKPGDKTTAEIAAETAGQRAVEVAYSAKNGGGGVSSQSGRCNARKQS